MQTPAIELESRVVGSSGSQCENRARKRERKRDANQGRWKLRVTDNIADWVRFAIGMVFKANIVLLAVWTVWFTACFGYRFSQFLWRTWLSNPF